MEKAMATANQTPKKDEGYGWIHLTFGAYTHVLPMNDTENHVVETPFCGCKPTVEGAHVIHKAYDGREQFDPSNKR